jgi:hypothetical protein
LAFLLARLADFKMWQDEQVREVEEIKRKIKQKTGCPAGFLLRG